VDFIKQVNPVGVHGTTTTGNTKGGPAQAPPGRKGLSSRPVQIKDTLFTHTTVANGYDHLKEYPELIYPSKHPKAAILERTTIQSLRLGTPIPVL
jgi:hypothetical protein